MCFSLAEHLSLMCRCVATQHLMEMKGISDMVLSHGSFLCPAFSSAQEAENVRRFVVCVYRFVIHIIRIIGASRHVISRNEDIIKVLDTAQQ